MDTKNIADVVPFETKDGSQIRELLSYRNSSIVKQSLAEARLPVGTGTRTHYHRLTEEIYYLVAGRGEMRIGDIVRSVGVGDAIAIPPGEIHQITNTGQEPLTFFCCCVPAYEHDDTILVEEE